MKTGICRICEQEKELYPRERNCLDCRRAIRREYMRKQWLQDPEKMRAQKRAWQKKMSPESRAKHYASSRAWAKRAEYDKNREREKIYARRKLQYHVKAGNVQRQPCEVCGDIDDTHAHHDDYSKPLDVRWLCPLHHAELHRAA